MRQRGFYNGTLKPLMGKAADGKETLLFLDASHFVMECDYLGFIYGKARRFVKSFSGRMRYNVLGAVDFATKKVVTVTNDTYITATEVKYNFSMTSNKSIPTHLLIPNLEGKNLKVKHWQHEVWQTLSFPSIEVSFCGYHKLYRL